MLNLLNYPIIFSKINTLNLQLAAPIPHIQRVIYKLELAIMGGVAVILLMSIFAGIYLTRRVLKPVEDVTRIAYNIIKIKNLLKHHLNFERAKNRDGRI